MSAIKLTCLACRVTFTDADLQRDHYKCEWHRYNLKRKVASLPPLSKEDFEKIEAQHKQKFDSANAAAPDFYCECCRKSFGNEKAFEQHNQSRKHVDTSRTHTPRSPSGSKASSLSEANDKAVGKVEELVNAVTIEDAIEEDDGDSDWESVSGEDDDFPGGDPVKPSECLFCGHRSATLAKNVAHMTQRHSFFIPDVEYLTDLEGLLTYLGEKVGAGLRCLWCCDTGKGFRSLLAVRRHMLDKGHCMMRLEPGETLLEYADFYDYSASYPDAESGADAEEEVAANELQAGEDLQLVLPSGATVGHRSLARYYKQNLRTTPLPPRPDAKKAVLHNLLSQYRALGWSGSNSKAIAQKRSDLQFLAKRQLKLGLTTNKVGQMHLRNQIFF